MRKQSLKSLVTRGLAITLAATMTVMAFPAIVKANDDTEDPYELYEEGNDIETIEIIGGYISNNIGSSENIAIINKFNARQGHGFAAERANNLIDRLQGLNSKVIGDNNIKNGPDRITLNKDGTATFIQSKYCKSAYETIDACFDNDGQFRYSNQKIEVPRDQYSEAISVMEEKIKKGCVSGVTDPTEAKNMVKPGKVTYKQAVNISKAGTVESLMYDATTGVITSKSTLGIAFIIDFAACKYYGMNTEESLKSAALTALEVGAVSIGIYVLTAQLMRTEFLKTGSQNVAKFLGPAVGKALLKATGQTAVNLTEQQIISKASVLVRGTTISNIAICLVLEAGDIYDIFNNRISWEQFASNACVTVATVAAGVGGSYVGGAIGTGICPGFGTFTGALLVGTLSSIVVNIGGKKIAANIYEGDARKMYDIIEEVIKELAEEYMVNQVELNSICNSLNKKLTSNFIKDMYSKDSKDKRAAYVRKVAEPLFEAQLAERDKITEPTEYQMRQAIINNSEIPVYVH